MAEIAWRRADEFRDFVGVLEFRAVDFDDGAWVSKKYLCRSFHYARFAGAGGSKEEKIADRATRGVKASVEDLEEVHEGLHAFLLANDLGAKRLMEVARVVAADAGV